jgi:hypothetical protein
MMEYWVQVSKDVIQLGGIWHELVLRSEASLQCHLKQSIYLVGLYLHSYHAQE